MAKTKPKFKFETIATSELKPHPRNYQAHPDDQIEHLMKSIEQHGIYRNIVIAKDNIILAGHGVWQAVTKLKIPEVPIIRVDVNSDDPRAIKLMVGDNEISNLGEVDDRALSELLKEIGETDIEELLGTGFDEKILANLVYVTRPQSEIADFNAATEWLGMPDFDPIVAPLKIIVSFENEDDRADFISRLDLNVRDTTKSIWWPPKEEKDDVKSIIFEG